MVCVAVVIVVASLCVVSAIGGIVAEDSNAIQNDSGFEKYSVSVDTSEGGIEGSSINTTTTPKLVDLVHFIVKCNDQIVSKYSFKCSLTDNNTFEITTNSLELAEGYENKVVIVPATFEHSSHKDVNGTDCSHSDGEYSCATVTPQSTKTVEILIIKGSPTLGTTVKNAITGGTNLKTVVIEGNPKYNCNVLMGTKCSNVKEIHFLSDNPNLPNSLVSSLVLKSLDVYLNSTDKTTIPGALLNPGSNSTLADHGKINLHFSEGSKTPASFGVGTNLAGYIETNFIIHANSEYWTSYLRTGKVASEVTTSEYSLITVTGSPSHKISCSSSEGGSIAVVSEAAKGESVVISVIPDDGYMLKELKYSYEGTYAAISDDGGYRFTMPDGDVQLVASFEKCIPVIESRHVVSGSQISIDVDLNGDRSDGRIPSSVSVYVKYAGEDGDKYSVGKLKIPSYSNDYSISYETSITSLKPVSYLIQVFAADGVCLNQKEVSISG